MAGWTGRVARLVRHRWRDEAHARRVIGADALERLTRRVAASEQRHSGQIRIYVESGLPASYVMRDAAARERAITMFGKLRVWDTEDNNGVLIYLLLTEHAIEIVSDRGLTSRVPPHEWPRIVEAMRGPLAQGRYEEGLNQAVDAVTALLVQHFPLQAGERNPNELPDEPVLG